MLTTSDLRINKATHENERPEIWPPPAPPSETERPDSCVIVRSGLSNGHPPEGVQQSKEGIQPNVIIIEPTVQQSPHSHTSGADGQDNTPASNASLDRDDPTLITTPDLAADIEVDPTEVVSTEEESADIVDSADIDDSDEVGSTPEVNDSTYEDDCAVNENEPHVVVCSSADHHKHVHPIGGVGTNTSGDGTLKAKGPVRILHQHYHDDQCRHRCPHAPGVTSHGNVQHCKYESSGYYYCLPIPPFLVWEVRHSSLISD